jgi:hypothetical protein
MILAGEKTAAIRKLMTEPAMAKTAMQGGKVPPMVTGEDRERDFSCPGRGVPRIVTLQSRDIQLK